MQSKIILLIGRSEERNTVEEKMRIWDEERGYTASSCQGWDASIFFNLVTSTVAAYPKNPFTREMTSKTTSYI